MSSALKIVTPAKDQIDHLFAKAYYDASIDGVNMLQAANLFEALKQSIEKNPRLQAWSDITIDREPYDGEPFIEALVDLRDSYYKTIAETIISRVKEELKADKELAWKIWMINFVEALMYGTPEVFDDLCRAEIEFPEQYLGIRSTCFDLNRYMLHSRWVSCYEPVLKLSAIEWLPPEQRARLLIFAAQIYIYWFPGYQLARKHLDAAASICGGEAFVERAFAEYYLKISKHEEALDHLLRAQLKDPDHLDNLLISGDISKDKGMHEAAETKYKDAITKNFTDASAYSRLVTLYGTPELFEKKKSLIPGLVQKAGLFETKYPVNHVLYNITRDAGYAFSINQDYVASEKFYNSAIEMQPHNSAAIIDLGYILAYQEKYREAEEQFQNALKIDRRTFEAYWALGWIYSQQTKENVQQNLEQAKEYYLECLAISPSWDGLINYTIGLMYETQDNLEVAKSHLEKAVKDNPSSTEYLLKLGGVYEKLQRFPDAASAYTKAADLLPTDPLTWNKLGNLYYDMGDFVKAKSYYQSAVDHGGNSVIYFKNLGLACRKLEQWQESIAAYTKATELKPDDPEALNAIGVAHFASGNYKEARIYYHRALQLSGREEVKNDAAIYWANIGLTWRDEGNLEEAKQAYQQSLELNPQSAENHNYAGIVYYRSGEFTKAIEHYKRAIELEPTSTLYENLGLVYNDTGEYEEAISYFKKAIDKDPTSHSAINYLGNVYFIMKEYEQARTYYEQAITLQPNNAFYVTNAGLTYYYRSDFPRALELFNEALGYNPEHLSALNHCANCNVFLGFINEAEIQFKKCIALNPSESYYYSNLALCFVKQNKLEEAEENLNTAISLSEQNKEAVSYIGLIYYKKGDMETAKKYYYDAFPGQQQDPFDYYQLLAPEVSKDVFEKAVENNPDDFFALWQLGITNYFQHNYVESKKYFSNAFDKLFSDPNGYAQAVENLKKADKEQWEAAMTVMTEFFKDDDLLSQRLADLKSKVAE